MDTRPARRWPALFVLRAKESAIISFDDCRDVAVRREEGTGKGVRSALRRRRRLDGAEPPDPIVSWQLVSPRPEPRVTLRVDRVLERNDRLRAAPDEPLGDDRVDRGATDGTRGGRGTP